MAEKRDNNMSESELVALLAQIRGTTVEDRSPDLGRELGPDLHAVQIQAQTEPAPKPVPLAPQKVSEDEEAGPPTAPLAKPGPAPRFVHQNERAPSGLKRFKVRATNYGHEQQYRYVLARSQKEAEQHYVKATGLGAVIENLGRLAPAVRLSVRELAD